MGAGGSKAAKSTVRKFPSRAPGSAPPPPIPKPNAVPRRTPPPPASTPSPKAQEAAAPPRPSFTKNEAIKEDSVNPKQTPNDFISPDFANRLKQMGIAQPNPTYSPSSIAQPLVDASGIDQSISKPSFPAAANNATLGVLESRRRLERQAQEEMENFGTSRDKGHEFINISVVKQILTLQERGESAARIEKHLNLKPGLVARLGQKGIVTPASL
ncbi:hypothetical protein QBC38DRAFT_471343 [Podospora fimiseda]|uniref:Helix-turn-helix domain-containing protein n=1 Tax=Podospora fimiseda TaxID=252190 RepID=A0AAN7BUM6_9PEZI|nr:hypothetical protein QBC38DRAFT_471343 [Podospora fimiseda]